MEVTPKISVVVPIYNVEEYLPFCINSILAQTYTNFEIILVDDGSPDNCGKICDQYAQKYQFIKVIHQINGGLSSARKTGVMNSAGELITFVDPDDSLFPDSLQILANNIGDYDILIACNRIVSPKSERDYTMQPRELNRMDYIKDLLMFKVPVATWARLYRRSLFTKENMDIPRKLVRAQDAVLNMRIAINIKKAKFISDVVYRYLVRETSTCRTFKMTEEYEKMLLDYLMQPLKDNGLYEPLYKYVLYYKIRMLKQFWE